MRMIKEIDMFGTGIQWRLLNRDTFKSYIGGLTTLTIIILFVLKIIFFINKVKNYGFADNQVSYKFQEDFQVTNFSEFRLYMFSDLDEKMNEAYKNNLTKINYLVKNQIEKTPFNLSDYLNITSLPHDSEKLENLQITQYECEFPDNSNYICLKFLPGKEI